MFHCENWVILLVKCSCCAFSSLLKRHPYITYRTIIFVLRPSSFSLYGAQMEIAYWNHKTLLVTWPPPFPLSSQPSSTAPADNLLHKQQNNSPTDAWCQPSWLGSIIHSCYRCVNGCNFFFLSQQLWMFFWETDSSTTADGTLQRPIKVFVGWILHTNSVCKAPYFDVFFCFWPGNLVQKNVFALFVLQSVVIGGANSWQRVWSPWV